MGKNLIFSKEYFSQKISDSEDLTEKLFSDIFTEISTLLSNSSLMLRDFIQENEEVSNYFKNKSNLAIFLSKINKLGEIEKTLIRDYYWFFLHTHEFNHFKECSTLISCSSNIDIAKKYSEGIIFEYFIPKPFSRYAITSMFTTETSSYISSLNLPTYNINKGIFDGEEDEISIRRGLFPHFILKVYIESEDKWYINPHFYNKERNSSLKKISKNGFSINQENFKQLLKSDTNLNSGNSSY